MSSYRMADDDVKLIGYDGEEIPVSREMLEKFPYFQGMIRLEKGQNVFRSEVADGYTFRKIAEWIKYEGSSQMPAINDTTGAFRDLNEFEKDFVAEIDDEDLVSLMVAADYFSLNNLLEILAAAAAKIIKSYSIEKIRAMFHIEDSGYTPEEEQKLKNDVLWALQYQD